MPKEDIALIKGVQKYRTDFNVNNMDYALKTSQKYRKNTKRFLGYGFHMEVVGVP